MWGSVEKCGRGNGQPRCSLLLALLPTGHFLLLSPPLPHTHHGVFSQSFLMPPLSKQRIALQPAPLGPLQPLLVHQPRLLILTLHACSEGGGCSSRSSYISPVS